MVVWWLRANGATMEFPVCVRSQCFPCSDAALKTRCIVSKKRPKLRDKQGLYAVIGMDGQILRRGHDLKTVLRVLERKLIRSVQ